MNEHLTELDRALGPVAVMSLYERGLIASGGAPNVGGAIGEAPTDPQVAAIVRDRLAGAMVGVAVGEVLARAAGSMERDGHGFVTRELLSTCQLAAPRGASLARIRILQLAIEAGLDAGLVQPQRLSDLLVDRGKWVGRAGPAIAAAIEGRRSGSPWFEAGVPSFGNGALIRAVASGAVWAAVPGFVPTVASLDAAVTHASPTATHASAVLASAIASLIDCSAVADADGVLFDLAGRASNPVVASSLAQAVGLAGADAREALPLIGLAPYAASTIAVAWWAVLTHPGDPVGALATVASAPGSEPGLVSITGALVGAIHGAGALPREWIAAVDPEQKAAALAGRIAEHLGVPPSPTPRPTPLRASDDEEGADIWFLLDRSGSMGSIATDVVEGFNSFFSEQQAQPGDARVSIVQFDDRAPHEVLVDHQPLATVRPLGVDRFQPRGTTPLFDAIGLLLDRAEQAGGHDADQLVVVFTDGHENASHHWDRQRLFERIRQLSDRGWTFVFLGANQDSYAAGGGLGVAVGNVSNFDADTSGVRAAFAGTNRATAAWRGKPRLQRLADRDDFWDGRKEGEERI